MDPHGDGQTHTQVEVGAAVLVEVILQLLVVLFSDIQREEGDVSRQRVGLLSPLNEGLIQVEAQEVNFPPVCFTLRLLHQMFV